MNGDARLDAGDPARPAPARLALVVAAAVYDGLLCVALLFVASAAAVALNGGEAIPPGTLSYDVVLLAVPFPYFGWCWTRGGQTLGMRAWRLHIRRVDGTRAGWRESGLRYLGALLSFAAAGLGFLWMLAPAGTSWHDRLSGTRIYRDA